MGVMQRSLHSILARLPLTLALGLSLAGCDSGGGGGGGGGGNTDGTPATVKLPAPSPAAGLFGQPSFKSAKGVTGVCAGDFDADGDMDAAASGTDGDVWFHINDGAGDLRAQRKMRFATATSWPVAGDFDGDGDDDVVVLQPNNNRVRVLRSNGDGTFKSLTAVPTLGSPRGLLMEDLNGDGLPELIVNSTNNVAVNINLGGGAFDDFVTSPLGPQPVANVLLADVAGDSAKELVYTSDTQLQVRSSLGNGNFVSLTQTPGNFSGPLVLADLDGDMVLDALTGDCQTIGWYKGVGDGTFFASGGQSLNGCRTSALSADLNGDGFLDTVVCNQAEVTVFMGSAGGPLAGQPYPMGQSRGLAVEDFDGDGLLDVLAGNWPTSELRLFQGLGDGTLESPLYVQLNNNPTIAIGDLDGDQRLDLVSPPRDLLTGLGDGSFAPLVQLPVAIGGLASFADLDLDTVADLIGSSATVYLGDGMGSIGAGTTYSSEYSPMVAIGDVNGDFIPDVVTPLRNIDQLAVLLGNGDGTLVEHATYFTGIQPNVLVLGHLDMDGILDLAVCNRKTDDLTIMLGAADGSFLAAPSVSTGDDPQDLVLADFDGDLRNDLVVATAGTPAAPGGVELYRGRGDGTFDPARPLGGANPVQVRAGDFDGDGRLDLAVADSNVWVLLNKGGSKFHAPAGFSAGQATVQSLAVADLDGDGLDDIVAGNQDMRLTVLISRGLTP